MKVIDYTFPMSDRGIDLTRNCDVDLYATTKMLPLDFLTDLGVQTVPNPYDSKRQAMAIPYRESDGTVHRERVRTGLLKPKTGSDNRMRWDKREAGYGIILYGLDRLAEPNDLPLIIVEGESDTQTAWLHGYNALGVPGATNFNPQRDDIHLENRNVVAFVEPDNGGTALIKRLSRSQHRLKIRIANLGPVKDVSELHTICPALFKKRLNQAIAKAVWLDDFLQERPELDDRVITGKPELPVGYRYSENGAVEFRISKDDDEEKWESLCSPVEIVATSRDHNQRAWGKYIRVKTADGHWHEVAIAAELLSGNGDDILKILLDLGLRFDPTPKKKAAILRLIARSSPKSRARCVSRVGWHGRSFVLPDAVYGAASNEQIVLQTRGPTKHAYRCSGSLEGWQEVAQLATGNSRLVFAASIAFSSPLLQLVEMEGGGFHLRGPSSIGKTTALQLAGSVWGGGGLNGYINRWRATDNGIEAIAAAHCDTLLCLDEMAEVDGNAAHKTAYMLANGQGKVRADRNGHFREPSEWRLIFLSTGEIGLGDKIAEAGRKVTAGQEVRIVDIPADAGQGFGVFDHLGEFNRPTELADRFKELAATHYGHAAPLFLKYLTADLEAARDRVRIIISEFVKHACPGDADGQVRRVARRFALVAAAGELAAGWDVVPWQAGEARRASRRCFDDWLSQRGGTEPAEIREGIARVRAFISEHGMSRFVAWNVPERPTPRRAGFRQKKHAAESWTYYVFSEVFRREICAGIDPAIVARALADRGMLRADSNGKYTRSERLPGLGNQRVYVLMPELFDQGDKV
jgi:uncharacterized protein (DUF927 family)